jgi:hypothetical protein
VVNGIMPSMLTGYRTSAAEHIAVMLRSGHGL